MPAPDPAEPDNDDRPHRMRVIKWEKVAGHRHIFEVTTESKEYGRVTQQLYCWPESIFAKKEPTRNGIDAPPPEPAPRSPALSGMSIGELATMLCSAINGGRLHAVIGAELERRIAALKERADAAERERDKLKAENNEWYLAARKALGDQLYPPFWKPGDPEPISETHELYEMYRGRGWCETPEPIAKMLCDQRDAAIAERDKLAKFKSWVHEYLDAHGVPYHPPGTHGAAGCRIGDRMDWLMPFALAPTPTPKAGDK